MTRKRNMPNSTPRAVPLPHEVDPKEQPPTPAIRSRARKAKGKRRGKPKAPKPARGRGRPTKYTPELGARIVGAVQLGATWETAAAAAGVDRETLRKWLREGARMRPVKNIPMEPSGKPLLRTKAHFLGAITRAEPTAELKWLSWVNKGAEADARHATWLLTHHPRTRERYADPTQRIEHSGAVASINVETAEVDLSQLTDDQLDQLERLINLAKPQPTPTEGT